MRLLAEEYSSNTNPNYNMSDTMDVYDFTQSNIHIPTIQDDMDELDSLLKLYDL